MNSLEYCYHKAAPKGSAFYFSLASMPIAQREMIVAIAAFYEELNDIIFECHDSMIAQTKFNWWRSEVLKLGKEKSDHPVLITLQKNWPQHPLTSQRFLEMIAGIEQNLNLTPFKSFEEVTIHIVHTVGIRELLIAEVCKTNSEIPPETIYALALVLELTNHLQYLRKDVERGLVFFGEDELANFGVTPAMLELKQTTPEILKLCDFQIDKINRAYTNAIATLNPAPPKSLLNLLIRTNIAKVTLTEIKNSHLQVLESLIYLTPLRQWWIAYKTRTCS
jgi:phytoene synthase